MSAEEAKNIEQVITALERMSETPTERSRRIFCELLADMLRRELEEGE